MGVLVVGEDVLGLLLGGAGLWAWDYEMAVFTYLMDEEFVDPQSAWTISAATRRLSRRSRSRDHRGSDIGNREGHYFAVVSIKDLTKVVHLVMVEVELVAKGKW